jgi:hypothetical protein
MSIAIGSVLLVIVVLLLVGLSLDTLRRFSQQDSLVGLFKDDDSSVDRWR